MIKLLNQDWIAKLCKIIGAAINDHRHLYEKRAFSKAEITTVDPDCECNSMSADLLLHPSSHRLCIRKVKDPLIFSFSHALLLG